LFYFDFTFTDFPKKEDPHIKCIVLNQGNVLAGFLF
jgi:hypothetical protein